LTFGEHPVSEEDNKSEAPSEAALEHAFEWLTWLNSGNARAEDWAAYRAWRRESPDNDDAARQAEALWDAIPEAHAPADAAGPGARVRRAWIRPAVVGAALAAACAIALWWMPALDRLHADYVSDVAELRDVALPDNSRLVLDGATAVDATFTTQARRLRLLEGRLYTEVAAEDDRPFTVNTSGLSITALGTAFTVTRTDDRTSVVVEEHAVRVALQDRPDASARTVRSGQKLEYAPDERMRVTNADLDSVAAWRDRLLVFHAKPLSDVIADLRRHVSEALWIVDPQVADLKVTGVIDLEDPDRAVRRLEELLPVRAHRLPGVVLLRSG
jgi:transmembrane sensor